MDSQITTRQLRAADIPVVRRVLARAFIELFDWAQTVDELLTEWDAENGIYDVNDAMQHYIGNRGEFRVVCEGETIVGMGAVRCLSDEVCELKRMWFLRAYRGRGLGRALALELIEWARDNGYKVIRLDSGSPPLFAPAHKMYRALGFVDVERYNDNEYATVWMEKQL